MLVTILTPTYNRCDKLPALKKSLENQKNKNFEWLIVDDGSTDQTADWVEQIKKETDFPVRYIKKANGGKHTALNTGVKEINSELTMIVDSDDVLLPDAVGLIEKYYEKYKSKKEIGVFSYLRVFSNGNAIVPMEQDEQVASYIQYRIKENRPGDMAEVFFTKVLKGFPFPEFSGERFLSEDVVWIQIGLKYKYVFINQPVYQCEYLEGGLTDNDKRIKFASPVGSMMRGKMLMSPECGLKINIKGAIIWNCYQQEIASKLPKEVDLITLREKILVFGTKLVGRYYNKKWKFSYQD